MMEQVKLLPHLQSTPDTRSDSRSNPRTATAANSRTAAWLAAPTRELIQHIPAIASVERRVGKSGSHSIAANWAAAVVRHGTLVDDLSR